jgi:autotransporter-associated beta strand protein
VIVESDTGTANDYALASRELGADSNPVLLRSYGTIFNAANAAATSNHNYTVQNGVFMANVTSLTLNGTIQIDTGYDAFFTAGGTTTCNGVISGGGGIQMSSLFTAPGDLVLTGSANTFTGKFIVPAGTITGSFDRSFGAVPASTTADFFTLSGGTLNASGTVSLDSKRGVQLNANTTFTIASPDYLRINGAISQNASGRTVSKAGTGSLALGGSNTFSGTTTLSAGTLSLENAGSLGGNGGLTISAASCTLDNAGSGAVTLTSTNVFAMNANYTFAGTQNLKLGTGNVTTSASRTITVTAGDFEIAGAITTATALVLTKNGNGRLILSGTNALTGVTNNTVTAGSCQFRNATAFGGSGGGASIFWLVSDGAAMEIGGGITGGTNLTASGTGVTSNGCLRFVDGTNTWNSGTIILNSPTANTIGVEAGTTTISTAIDSTTGGVPITLRPITSATLNLSTAPTASVTSISQLGGGTVNVKAAITNQTYSISVGIVNVDTGGTLTATVTGGTYNLLSTGTSGGASVSTTGTANIYKNSCTTTTVTGGGTFNVRSTTGSVTHRNITLGSVSGTATFRIMKT